ncbi:MAG: phosphoribosylamine--glycine ligase [Geminicoccaceae bacterium]|nr:phosphoribosylamine--glycine ligase [Geminicoccaceae bacterium]MCS7269060.1 phosphoribosylamine--glycine ligase [Geminicoccaceae bacterium]MCX7629111.1 phosphoribosylamine--glycine ligase [Geminicoccaceae bacterium]MDW8124877.1 phosphoribosylamine--glycine ligase [Geminicoccaceae bacterium]MDW8342396.1 phosphoribosylamine--glycine ligase [Geminicoccaceae bacterium]
MRILVVGSGAREHALCWSLAASPLVKEVLCAPGNAGIARDARLVPIASEAIDDIVRFAVSERVDLVVVGPEKPLALGLVDRLQAAGVRALGPSAAAARLESSKVFAKDFCRRHGIPTAAYRVFEARERDAARAWIEARGAPIVVKADGLAAGKGVTVAATVEEALAAVDAAFGGAFGEAGARIVVEEMLEGEEASLFALCDGTRALVLGTAQDHKRAFDGDRGPNTGGMGAYSPAPVLSPAMIERVMNEIVRPALAGMAAEGAPFRGILYAGLMIGPEGPKLLEFNVRMGDPECQVILPRLMTDFGQLAFGAVDGVLASMSLRWYPNHALGVVLATRGYPGPVQRGSEIRGLETLNGLEETLVFHAATRREQGRWIADGGRVLTVVGTGATLAEARDRAYVAVARIDWPEGFFRRDIGWRALARSATD